MTLGRVATPHNPLSSFVSPLIVTAPAMGDGKRGPVKEATSASQGGASHCQNPLVSILHVVSVLAWLPRGALHHAVD
jgi:hypothetical protein